MSKSNIIYIFGPGRKEKLNDVDIKAKEFFYGFHYLSTKNNIEIIEANKNKDNISGVRFLLNLYDRIIVKLTSFPSYSIELISIANKKKLKNFEKRIFTTDALFVSVLPIVLIEKLFFRRNKNLVITMGLFGKKPKNIINKTFDWLFIRLVIFSANKFLFLGEGEFNFAKNNYPKVVDKFTYLPFCVDTEFWSPRQENNKKGVLFVGNDGKRDYELFLKIVNSMQDVNFTAITNFKIDKQFSNLNIVKGSWSEHFLSDNQMKDYYLNSELTIIPLKDSLQPSGQSVGMQSLSCGTPILVTETDGFWGDENFKNNLGINFVSKNSTNSWVDSIYKILENKSKNNINVDYLNKNFDISIFNKKLENILNSI